MTDAEMLAGPMTRLDAVTWEGDMEPLVYSIPGPWGIEFCAIPEVALRPGPEVLVLPLVLIQPLWARKN